MYIVLWTYILIVTRKRGDGEKGLLFLPCHHWPLIEKNPFIKSWCK